VKEEVEHALHERPISHRETGILMAEIMERFRVEASVMAIKRENSRVREQL